jgi:cysteine-S-conjugate beta-lyase
MHTPDETDRLAPLPSQAPESEGVSAELQEDLSDTSGKVEQLIEEATAYEAYEREHFRKEVMPASERAGTVPESAWMQVRSPKAVEDVLAPHTPDWRAGYFSYGDKTPDKYGELDEGDGFPELRKPPNMFAASIHKLLGHKEVNEQDLRDAFSVWLKEEHGIEVPDDEMIFCKSIYSGITAAWESCDVKRPKHMGVITPFYDKMMTYLERDMGYTKLNNNGDAVERSGAFSHLGLIDTDEGWKFDATAFELGLDAAEPQISSLLFCSPNNPTGYIFSEDDLRKIILACKKRDILILSDEAWADLTHHPNKKHIPTLKVARELGYAEGVVMQYGPSKAFNTAGFPCAMIVVPDKKLREKMRGTLKRPSQLAAEAAIAGYSEGKEHVQHLRRFLRENLEFVANALRSKGYRVHVPDSTYVIYPHIGDEHDNIAAELKEVGIFTRNKGEAAGAEGYFRLTAGVPREVLEKCYREWMEIK